MTDLHDSADLDLVGHDGTEVVERDGSDGVERHDTEGAEAPDELRRFRGSTFDEALAAASTELGDGVEVVEANRIRRGGLGGFFATDLGVEVIVAASAEDHRAEVSRAVDRLLTRLDGADRFVPSEVAEAPAPHPFAERLDREMRAVDATAPEAPTARAGEPLVPPTQPDTGVTRSTDLGHAPMPSTSPDTSTTTEPLVGPRERPAAADLDVDTPRRDGAADALADIDALLARAGVEPPRDPPPGPSDAGTAPRQPLDHRTADTTTATPCADPTPATPAADVAGGSVDPEPPHGADAAPTPPAATTLPAPATPSPELLRSAAEAVVEQLASIDSAHGSRSLRRMKVKITSPDGTEVTMSAEWDDDE
ncbi:hypothetical protein [Ilumatobacter sp.]|uniref:hypothetical protein n=1 Tax=Ilumatobacter sp. TaxID=1967498 RepID=UPI003B517BF6